MNYYEVLEISPKASQEVVKMAYKALAKKFHPDIFNGDKDYAENKMKELNEAYEVISNIQKRKEFDQFIYNVGYNVYQKAENTQTTYETKNTTNSDKSSYNSNKSDEKRLFLHKQIFKVKQK